MNTGENDNLINEILKEAHEEIQPRDSWEALKSRIDKKVFDEHRSSPTVLRLRRNSVFWRRIALALAACLVITTGLLVYVLGDRQSDRRNQIISADKGFLSREQLGQLSVAFSHVQELFGTACPWMVIDSGGEGEIGVDERTQEAADSGRVIIIRLAINVEGRQLQRRYLDIVTLPEREANFNITVADNTDIGVSIKPFITSEGKITIVMNAETDSVSQKSDMVTVADNKFTCLTRIKSNSNWVSIDATGQLASNI